MTITHEMLIKVQQLVVVVMLMLMAQLRLVDGHGYVMDPPQRSSMWRFGYNTPINYDDDHLFCGGVTQTLQICTKTLENGLCHAFLSKTLPVVYARL
nr:hypothetical protein BaRGS_022924 [Batillaria attramentaria]